MRTIIFPTNFSSVSENAEIFAIDLAKSKMAKLFFVYVEEDQNSSLLFDEDFISQKEEMTLLEGAYEKLKEIPTKYKENDFEAAYLVKEGDVVSNILELIDELDADILVMGTNGNDNYERNNSNATKIIRDANCSVFTIPKDAHKRQIDTIVYATDLIHKDKQSFDHLVKFAKVYNSKIILLHINIDGTDVPGKGPLLTIPEVLDMIRYENIESEIIVASTIMEGIERFTEKNNVDLLAFTSHSNTFLDRFFNESITEKMVLSANLPILTFPK